MRVQFLLDGQAQWIFPESNDPEDEEVVFVRDDVNKQPTLHLYW